MTLEPYTPPRAELAPAPDTDSWVAVVAEVGKLAGMIASTEFVPAAFRDNPAATAAAILYGRECGLGPMTSLTQLYVTNGKPSMYAEGMRALVLAAGHDLQTLESTGAICSMRGRRRGGEWSAPVAWTLDTARAAGLIPARAGSGWANYPRAMLLARVTAELCRRDFPDVIHGLIAYEELDDPKTPGGAPAADSAPSGRAVTRKRARPAPSALPGDPHTPAGDIDPPEPPTPPERPLEASDIDPPPPELADSPGGEAMPSGAEDGEGGTRPPAPPPDPARSIALKGALIGEFRRIGIADRDDRLDALTALTGRPITTSNKLTEREARQLMDTLKLCKTSDDLDAVILATLSHREGAEPADPNQPELPLDETTPDE